MTLHVTGSALRLFETPGFLAAGPQGNAGVRRPVPRTPFPDSRCNMKTAAAVIQFVLAALLAIFGVLCCVTARPWDFLPEDPLVAAQFSWPLPLAVVLFVTGLLTLPRKPTQRALTAAETRADNAEAESAALRAELARVRRAQTGDSEAGIQERPS